MRTDPLFLGMTRPPFVWGVPFSAFVLNVMGSTMAFLALSAAGDFGAIQI